MACECPSAPPPYIEKTPGVRAHTGTPPIPPSFSASHLGVLEHTHAHALDGESGSPGRGLGFGRAGEMQKKGGEREARTTLPDR